MEDFAPLIEEYGLSGIVVIGCVYILRVIIMWLLARTEAKDAMIDARHIELVDLTRNVMSYVNESKDVNKELILEIRNMGEGICSKIDNAIPPEKKGEE